MKTLKYLISISWMPLALIGWALTHAPFFKYVLWGFAGISFLISVGYIIHAFGFPPAPERREMLRRAALVQPFKQRRVLGLVIVVLMTFGLFRYVNNSIGTTYLLSVFMLQVGRAKLIGRL